MSRDDAPLPLFPLSNVVLFPGIRTPLHVFEPRYRQLTEHALAGDRRIGMVAVPPEHAGEMLGDPPLFSVGCAGEVCESEQLPDGRYNIVLLGTRRFRILGERPRDGERLYRVAEIEPLPELELGDGLPRVAALRSRASELVVDLLRAVDAERGGRATSDRLAQLDDATFTNALCNALALAPREKQALLEADGVAARLARLVDVLDFHAAERNAPAAPGSGAVH